MKHLLAYGNSDQASFRHPDVRECFDIMTVPSTIAAYYPDATAGFVLSSELDYVIEPRTPLFQDSLPEPRASHYELAKAMGDSVKDQLGPPNPDGPNPPAHFTPGFYSRDICSEVVDSMVRFQRTYGQRADAISKQIARYGAMLQKAKGEPGTGSPVDLRRGPAMVLCPYFACSSLSDPWWSVTNRVWHAATTVESPEMISPVVALGDVFELTAAIQSIPEELSRTIFLWVPSFDERIVPTSALREFRRVVSRGAQDHEVYNLYGGFFSILLAKSGLSGFNNGLGYSEYRAWPTLDATGAAPARYYVRRLHAYLPTATATALVEQDPKLRCKCPVCDGGRKQPIELDYHELKRHFALARLWELELVQERSVEELRKKLRKDADRIRSASAALPRAFNIRVDHLYRWAEALAD